MKTLVFLMIMLVASIGFAAETNETLIFGWSQAQEDYPNLDRWSLWWSESSSGGWVLAADIPYTGGAGPDFTSTQPLIITGLPGASITKYFMMSAWGKNGIQSGGSNIVNRTFTIPYSDVHAPQSLTIDVVVRTKGN